ncbi:MAG: radical SAM protein [Candidatus Omnitrophota bacterium]
MMDTKVVLIYPKSGFEIENINIFMPMGLMCLAAPLVEKGIGVEILDQRLENDFFFKLKEILKNNPICIGITAMTGMQILYALEIAKFIRNNSKVPIVWGGVHPTLTAEQTLENENVDIIVRGEGDITFDELVVALQIGESFKNIKGISWKDGEGIYHNPDREFCDMDTLARIPYHLVDVERYLVPQTPNKKRCLQVYTSRGCPSSCLYCYNTKFNKSRYRVRNIDNVIKEVEWLVGEYNLDSFCINDDNFSVDIKRMHYFCRRLIEKNIILEWSCSGLEIWRTEKKDVEILEKSGCRRVLVGIESGSEKVLKFIKRQDRLEDIKNMINIFADSKIIPHYSFIIGFPVEGKKELYETMDLFEYIEKTDPKAYRTAFHIYTPFPGTEMFRISVEKYGFRPPSRLEDWHNFRLEEINIPWILPEERNYYLNLCFISFFLDDKLSQRFKNNMLLKLLTDLYRKFARYRWKCKQFEFCPEFKLLSWLVNYNARKKIRQIKNNLRKVV